MGPAGSALSAAGLGIRLRGGRWLFRDLSVELAPGELVRLSGPTGSGVTALLQIFAGVLAPTRGSIRLRTPSVGYVPQHFPQNLPLSAQEYLRWLGRIRGMRADVREQRISELLGSYELGASADQRLNSIIGTREQVADRLGVMQALLDEPSLLVLDDPWTSTDGHLRELLARQVQQLVLAGCLVVYSGYAPSLRPSRYLSLSGGRLHSAAQDPERPRPTQLRLELTGRGAELTSLTGVIEQQQVPHGLLVIADPEHADQVLLHALQSGWSVRRVEPGR